MTERWKTVPGYAPYQVSNLGNVRNGRKRALTPCLCSGGMTVTVCIDGVKSGFRLARVVGQLFCKSYREHLYPKYRDGDLKNCSAKNLRWVPRREVTGVPYSKRRRHENRHTREIQICGLPRRLG